MYRVIPGREFSNEKGRAARVALVAYAFLYMLLVPVPVDATAVGTKVGGGAGAPAMYLEHSLTERMVFTAALGVNPAFAGMYGQLGAKRYSRLGSAGSYAHAAVTLGRGRIGGISWSTVELGILGGYSWALTCCIRLQAEVGYGTGEASADGGWGRVVLSRSGRILLGVALLAKI